MKTLSKTKVLSILLAVILIVGVVPASIFAVKTEVQWKGCMNVNGENNNVLPLGNKTPTSKDTTVESWYTIADAAGYPSTQVIIGDYLYCYNGKLVKYDLNGNKVGESESFGTPNSIGRYEYLTATDDGDYIFVTFSGKNSTYVIKTADLSVALTTEKTANSSYPTAQYHNGYLFINGNIYKFETEPKVSLTQVGTLIGTKTVSQTISETPKDVVFSMTFSWSSGAFAKHGTGASEEEWFYVTGYDNNTEKSTGVGTNKKITQYASETYQKGIIYAVDYATGEVKDQFVIDNFFTSGSMTTTGQVTYDKTSGYLFWGSYSAKKMFAIKLKTDGTFDDASFKEVDLNQSTVCSPVIVNGRAYLAGQAGYINVINVDPNSESFMTLIYSTSNQIFKIQSNPLVFVDEQDNAYVFAQSYVASGHLYCLTDNATKTSGSMDLIATPSGFVSYDAETFSGTMGGAFAYEQLCADSNGRIYLVNDSGYLYCYERAEVKTPVLTKDLTSDYVKYNMLDEKDEVESLEVSAESKDEGEITYQWQKSSDKITWTDIEDATNNSITPEKEISDFYYRCRITNTKGGKSATVNSTAKEVEVKNFSSDTTVKYIMTSSNSASGTKTDVAKIQKFFLTTAQLKYRIWLDAPELGSISVKKIIGTDTFSSAVNQSNYEYRFFCSAGVKGLNVFVVTAIAEDGTKTDNFLFVAPEGTEIDETSVIYDYYQSVMAEAEKALADEKAAKELAEKNAADEKTAKELAETNKKLAEDAKKLAEDKEKLAEDAKKLAEDNEKLALEAKKLAEDNEKLALEAKKLAEDNEKLAKEAKEAAEKKLDQAEIDRLVAEQNLSEEEAARLVAENKATEAETAKKAAEQKTAEAETAKKAAEQRAAEAEKKASNEATARVAAEEAAASANAKVKTAYIICASVVVVVTVLFFFLKKKK